MQSGDGGHRFNIPACSCLDSLRTGLRIACTEMMIMTAKHSIGIYDRMNNQVDTLIINGFSNPAALKSWSSTFESFAGVQNYDAMTQPRCP